MTLVEKLTHNVDEIEEQIDNLDTLSKEASMSLMNLLLEARSEILRLQKSEKETDNKSYTLDELRNIRELFGEIE